MITKREFIYARVIALSDMRKEDIIIIPIESDEIKRLLIVINFTQ